MAKRKLKQNQSRLQEPDSVYFLKMVLYLIMGSLWVKVTKGDAQIPVPVGFLIGLLFTTHEHFKVDRRMEYVILLIASFVGFWTPIGLYITL